MHSIPRVCAVMMLSTFCASCGDGPATPGQTSHEAARARFEVTGLVEETGEQGFPIQGAQARLTTSGLTATTESNGTFAITTSSSISDTQVEISKPGFQTMRVAAAVNGPAVHVQLPRTGPPPDYSGTYTFTLGGDGICPQLPAPLRQRTYTATLTQSWPLFEIRMSGNFVLNASIPDTTGNLLRGSFIHDREMRFLSLSEPSSESVGDLVERLPDGTVLAIWGGLTSTLVDVPFGSLTGGFDLFDGPDIFGTSPRIRCTGSFPYALTR